MEQVIPQNRENYIGILDTIRGFLAFWVYFGQFKGHKLLKVPDVPKRDLTIPVFQIRGWENAI